MTIPIIADVRSEIQAQSTKFIIMYLKYITLRLSRVPKVLISAKKLKVFVLCGLGKFYKKFANLIFPNVNQKCKCATVEGSGLCKRMQDKASTEYVFQNIMYDNQ